MATPSSTTSTKGSKATTTAPTPAITTSAYDGALEIGTSKDLKRRRQGFVMRKGASCSMPIALGPATGVPRPPGPTYDARTGGPPRPGCTGINRPGLVF
jgi:hypothetical protein